MVTSEGLIASTVYLTISNVRGEKSHKPASLSPVYTVNVFPLQAYGAQRFLGG
jgi:hypothetical protein